MFFLGLGAPADSFSREPNVFTFKSLQPVGTYSAGGTPEVLTYTAPPPKGSWSVVPPTPAPPQQPTMQCWDGSIVPQGASCPSQPPPLPPTSSPSPPYAEPAIFAPSTQMPTPGTVVTTSIAPAAATSILYKFGMSPTLWGGVAAIAAAAGAYALYKRRKG